jgi:hypothetical protein
VGVTIRRLTDGSRLTVNGCRLAVSERRELLCLRPVGIEMKVAWHEMPGIRAQ